MIQAAPNAEPLDLYLREVIRTLETATSQGIRNLKDAPEKTDAALHDCEEILDVIMAGKIQEWLA